MNTTLITFIAIYGIYNIVSKSTTLEKIERWLYLLALIGFNILIK